jgi:hypothetical protein
MPIHQCKTITAPVIGRHDRPLTMSCLVLAKKSWCRLVASIFHKENTGKATIGHQIRSG